MTSLVGHCSVEPGPAKTRINSVIGTEKGKEERKKRKQQRRERDEKKKKGGEKMWTHVESGAWYRCGGVQISMLRHQCITVLMCLIMKRVKCSSPLHQYQFQYLPKYRTNKKVTQAKLRTYMLFDRHWVITNC